MIHVSTTIAETVLAILTFLTIPMFRLNEFLPRSIIHRKYDFGSTRCDLYLNVTCNAYFNVTIFTTRI